VDVFAGRMDLFSQVEGSSEPREPPLATGLTEAGEEPSGWYRARIDQLSLVRLFIMIRDALIPDADISISHFWWYRIGIGISLT